MNFAGVYISGEEIIYNRDSGEKLGFTKETNGVYI